MRNILHFITKISINWPQLKYRWHKYLLGVDQSIISIGSSHLWGLESAVLVIELSSLLCVDEADGPYPQTLDE